MSAGQRDFERAIVPGVGWTDERVELLKKLWQDGLSASQIAKQFGDVSRNAVIGKVTRLGMPKRTPDATTQSATWHNRENKLPSKPVPAPRAERPSPKASPLEKALNTACANAAAKAAPPPERSEVPGLRTILTVGLDECRYPIGDPQHEGFTICGKQTAGQTYCGKHDRLAHAPEITRTRLDLRLGLPAQRRVS